MKKKMLACLLCVAVALAAGCGMADDASENGTEDSAEEVADGDTDNGARDEAEDAEDGALEDEENDSVNSAEEDGGEAYHFELIGKAYQSGYWQAVVSGAEQAAAELGVALTCIGTETEYDGGAQVAMLEEAVYAEDIDGIGLAACDPSACLDALQTAVEKGVPVVSLDSEIADAPAGAVCAVIAADGYDCGVVAAEKLYEGLRSSIQAAIAPVRVGVVNQDAVSATVLGRGLGFIETFAGLAAADGKAVAVIGNDAYVNSANIDAVAETDADIIVEVAASGQATAEQCAAEAAVIMGRADVIGMFGSSQTATEGILSANESLNVLGTDSETTVLAAGFDSGSVIVDAISSGKLYGAVTQSPFTIGANAVRALYAAATGERVEDASVGAFWYNAENVDDALIAQSLYD